MDYLQTLEFQMAALQRKIRLLQDLRFFVETSSSEELSAFGDELRAVLTSSGISVGSVLAAVLGASGLANSGGGPGAGAAPAQALGLATGRQPPASPIVSAASFALPSASSSVPGVDTAQASAADSSAPSAPSAPPPSGAGASSLAPEPASGDAAAAIEASMKSIPAGPFLMGSDQADSEKPPHKVGLGAYRLCDHLVTNREYAMFVAANPGWAKDRADPELRDESYLLDWEGGAYPEGKDDHPVAYVSFFAAQAFAQWLGRRLPTEAEWERAARGGLVGKKYPNGDQMNDKLANLAKQFRGTTPVRKFEANGFGLFDMAGNLFEWTADWYAPYPSVEAQDPKGPAEGEYKVVRGGSWMSGAGALRVSARVDMEPSSCGQVGIRLADGGA
jgi:Uncharacterized conserved protein